ncbi:hypothetical protein [Rufibacter quisquiliarum]|uniref:Trypsin-like peptidase domain-containing protein n=1 Tax=Rufibacter quisquiliarum TaxID=1549639 RepID=A0A839GIL4_9BACT|nr:hypothetical protein [Rufibacter quisquiliarum]MBA9077533.1 hypothetical protein [Rufibacter quisquiliarum]
MIISTSEFFNEITINTGKQILRSLCQFYKTGEKGIPKGFGTGFFIKISNKHFLITAAHVSDDKDIYILKDGSELRFAGKLTSVINEKRENDKFDFSFLELDEQSIIIANEHFVFLEENILLLNHSITDNIGKPQYFLCGFPSSKTTWKYKTDKIITDPFLFTTKTKELTKPIQDKGFVPEANIVLDYDKEKILTFGSNMILTGPDPYGISGCPLWFFPRILTDNYIPDSNNLVLPVKLIGIMIEYHKDEKIMVGTRIDYVINLINNNVA